MTSRIRPGDFAEITAFAAVAQARLQPPASVVQRPRPRAGAVDAVSAEITAFAAVSFRRAARDGSKRGSGGRLLHRTTRSVAPTEAGHGCSPNWRPRWRPSTARWRVRDDGRRGGRHGAACRPRVAPHTLVAPAATHLPRTIPHLTLDVHSVEHPGDPIADGFELAIQLGDTISQDLVAVALTP